jgi:hypothetical protein
MKLIALKLPVSLLAAFIILQSGTCEKKTDCIDPLKIDSTAVCTMIYHPVCGCDGNTYPNACVAAKSGVTKWAEGACGEQKQVN